MYPLTSLSYMLLAWQKGQLDEAALSDSDCDEEGSDDEGEPKARYATEEQYKTCVPLLARLPIRQYAAEMHWHRRMKRLETHYSALSVEVLFKTHPDLRDYLEKGFDDDLVSEVRLSSCTSTSPVSVC